MALSSSTESASNDAAERGKVDLMRKGLRLIQPGPAGVALGLKRNDRLIAINGIAFIGDLGSLNKRMKKTQNAFVAFTFMRENREWNVLTNTADLGRWGVCDAVEDTQRARVDPQTLENFELFVNHKREYDLQSLSPSNLAVLMTMLWLAQMRLWSPLMIIFAAVLVTLPIGIWIGLSVYGLASVYVWRSARELFRSDRVAKGFLPFAVVAATSEAEAHRVCGEIAPGLRFAYSGAPGASMKPDYYDELGSTSDEDGPT